MDNSRLSLERIFSKVGLLLNPNTLKGSKKNIAAHYDLSNEFFSLFLDSTMMYSAAIYPYEAAPLEESSVNKLRILCEKLQLQESDHLLEIGTGWGGLAIYAAKNYGCTVTTATISKRQYDYAREKAKAAGLANRINVVLKDYRDIHGEFDKIVSIEMVEAVGHQFYSTYFSKCSVLLKENGLMVLQAITINDQRYEQAKNSVDFIKKYIF